MYMFIGSSGEGFKDLIHKVFAHTDTVIFKHKLIASNFSLITGLFGNGDLDLSSVRGEFHCISHQVSEYLLDTKAVSDHRFMGYAGDIDAEFMVMFFYL